MLMLVAFRERLEGDAHPENPGAEAFNLQG
jgi:hypothetical protein